METWSWAIIGLASFGVLVSLILCIPLDMELVLDTTTERRLQLHLVKLFGVVRFNISKTKRKPGFHVGGKRRGINTRSILRCINTEGFLPNVKNLALRILHQIRIKEATAKLTIGFDDPADGGAIFAIIGILRPILRLPKQYNLEIRPSLSDHSFVQGYLQGILSIQPVKLVIPVSRFIFSPPTFKIARIMISRKLKTRTKTS